MKRILKGVGLLLGVLVGLVVVAAGVLYVRTGMKLNKTYEVTPAVTSVRADSVRLARGNHLAQILFCNECHGEGLAGNVMVDAPPFRMIAPNLTAGKGGIGRTFTDADWDRALRHGVGPDGKVNIVMPAPMFHHLSDADAEALIAYLKTMEPVDNELAPTEIRFLGRVLFNFMLDVEQYAVAAHTPVTHPTPGPTRDYGQYLTSIACTECHGEDLRGGPSFAPEGPPVPDLTAAGAWTFDLFKTALRDGVRPSGQAIDPEWMPVEAFQHMTDDEMQAIHQYLQTLPDQAVVAAN